MRSVVLVLILAGLAWAVQARPINSSCPVKGGMESKASITATWQGYTIGFC
jgi:hypothetical protein